MYEGAVRVGDELMYGARARARAFRVACDYKICCCCSVRWFEDAFDPLFDYYLEHDYVNEHCCLASALLDPNCGVGGLEKIDAALAQRALDATYALVQKRGDSVVASRTQQQQQQQQPAGAPASTMLAQLIARTQSSASSTPTFNARHEVDTLLAEMHRRSSDLARNTHVDPVRFYTGDIAGTWPVVAEFALNMFTISAGEASCERMFSAAGYFDASRRDFAPKTLSMLTLCKYRHLVQ